MTTDTPGKAAWAGFSTEPVDAPRSLVQDTLPADTPAPTPKPASTPKTPATSSAPDYAAIMYGVQNGRTLERSVPFMIGLGWLFIAVGGVVIAVGLAILTQIIR